MLSAANASSYPFDISADPVKRLRYDSLAFFYHQRSGIAIDAQYVGSTYARAAGHLGVSPNQGDTSVPCRQSCGYSLDVRGGWYDAGDQGKYVVNGGIATWQLLNAYERTLYVAGADKTALGDGTMAIPERANGVPDILDEARWEVEFLLWMQVPDGRTTPGMVHHKIHDENWTGAADDPRAGQQRRLLSPVEHGRDAQPGGGGRAGVAAVEDARPDLLRQGASTAAQTRVHRGARRTRTGSRPRPTARAAAPTATTRVTDEFYWAAAELYATTGSTTYRADVTGSSLYKGGSFAQRGLRLGLDRRPRRHDARAGPERAAVADVAATRAAIVTFADAALARATSQALPGAATTPASVYYWGSNGQVANNANVLALAYDFTGQAKYRTGVYAALDYFQGRNPLNQSYIAGYGEKAGPERAPPVLGAPGERVPADRAARLVLRRPEQRAPGPDRRGAARGLRAAEVLRRPHRGVLGQRGRDQLELRRWPGSRAGRPSTPAARRRSTPRRRARRARRRRARSARRP